MLANYQKSNLFWIWKSVVTTVTFNNLLMYAWKYDNTTQPPDTMSAVSAAFLFSGIITFSLPVCICILAIKTRCYTWMLDENRPPNAANEGVYALMTNFLSCLITMYTTENLYDKKSLILAATLIPIATGLLASATAVYEKEIGVKMDICCSRLFGNSYYQPVNGQAENPNPNEAPAIANQA